MTSCEDEPSTFQAVSICNVIKNWKEGRAGPPAQEVVFHSLQLVQGLHSQIRPPSHGCRSWRNIQPFWLEPRLPLNLEQPSQASLRHTRKPVLRDSPWALGSRRVAPGALLSCGFRRFLRETTDRRYCRYLDKVPTPQCLSLCDIPPKTTSSNIHSHLLSG